MKSWVRAVVALLVVLVSGVGGVPRVHASIPAGTTVVGSTSHGYDAPAMKRVEAYEIGAVDSGLALLSDVREGSVWRPPELRGASTTPVRQSIATNTADDITRLADDYIDITAKGSRVRNVQTSVSRSSFEQNLIGAGYQPTLVSPGKNVVSYELNGSRYVVRDAATSASGPTADFYPVGSSSFTLKIRLGG